MIFIFSVARSGSTWLGKIFDSHPDVIYLHEPTVSDRGHDLMPRFWLADDPSADEIAAARTYLQRLAANRSVRATGTFPMFRKSYRNRARETIRRAIILLGKAAGRAGIPGADDDLRVPDLLSDTHAEVVIKSVSATGYAQRFVEAASGRFRPIHLLRHPCGYVRSMLVGKRLGVMDMPNSMSELFETRSGSQFFTAVPEPEAAPDCERLAWCWLIQNLEAQRAIESAGGLTLHYETLAKDPIATAKTLFAAVGLSWSDQTERFLSHARGTNGRFYSIRRDSLAAIGRWRTELDGKQVSEIRRVVERSELGRAYFV